MAIDAIETRRSTAALQKHLVQNAITHTLFGEALGVRRVPALSHLNYYTLGIAVYLGF